MKFSHVRHIAVVFRGPTVVRACVVDEGVVELTWAVDTSGWVTRSQDLLLLARDGSQLDQQSLSGQVRAAYTIH